jgi:SET domain-containing protein
MSLTIKKTFAGKGLFATRDFKKGEFIIEYFGSILIGDEVDRHWANRYLFELTPTKTINGAISANVARYINHGCRPNAYAEGGRRMFIKAGRKIRAGEEITFNYGKDYLSGFIKRCKCPHCKAKRAAKARAA